MYNAAIISHGVKDKTKERKVVGASLASKIINHLHACLSSIHHQKYKMQ